MLNMMRIHLLVSMLLVLFSCLPVTAEEMKSEDLYKRVLQSTFTLFVETADGTCNGSGFLSIKDGIGVTAWHVMEGAKRATVKFSSGEEFQVSGLIDKDETRDVCLIRIKVADRPLLPLAPGDPEVGSKAYAIGAPQGLEFSISDGLVSQVRTMEGIKQYQFTCAVSPGNSGGPLVNAAGEVLGVVSWSVIDGQNLNFAVPVSYVRGLDATLPTCPWDQVKADPGSLSKRTLSDEDADRLFAEVLSTEVYFSYACALMSRAASISIFEKSLIVSKEMYVAMEKLRTAIAQLNSARMNGKREEARKCYLERLLTMQKAGNCFIEGVRVTQRNRSWHGEPHNLWAQGRAYREMLEPVPSEYFQPLRGSSVIQKALPLDIAIAEGITEDRTSYIFGIRFFGVEPSYIDTAYTDGFAYQLGFRDEDWILAVDDKPFTTMLDFKLTLSANLGKTLKVKVWRDNKEKTLTVRLPKAIPEKYLKK